MFPFNISSYIRDLITFDHLSDKNQVQFMQKHFSWFFSKMVKVFQKSTVFQAFFRSFCNF